MRCAIWMFVLTLCVPYAIIAQAADTTPVSQDEARWWIRYTIPLPKQIEITGKLSLSADKINFEKGNISAPLVAQAVKELRECLSQKPDLAMSSNEQFTVSFQLGGPNISKLNDLKNNDQSYLIIPNKQNNGLQLVAITPRGLYYAAKTLQQLIRAKAREGEIEMPVVTVTDWPDIADRGVWGTDTPLHISWLGDRKFNYMEQVATNVLDENKRPVVTMNKTRRAMIDEGPMNGINPVPAIVHLERLGGRGVYKAYPELKGKGEGVHKGAACYSNPKIVDILAEWIVGCVRLPGATEVDVWMTENLTGQPGCQCDKCRLGNRDLLEARVILDAWEKAKKTVPDVGLRLLVTEETYDSNEQILEILPKEVVFWYYHSLTTYSNRETQIIPDYIEKMAKQGYRMGIVPDIGVKGGHAQPFTGAHYIHYRMNEFVDKNIAALLGYPRPRVYYSNFNTEATAEWSWNAKGRSTHEFALSWAVRQGLKDPELFAEWSETLGPVSWDVYGSEWPRGERRRKLTRAAKQLEEGTLPELGDVLWGVFPKPWGDIKSIRQLNDDVANATRAIEMARAMGIPRYLQESIVIQGYIHSLKALYELKHVVKPEGIPEDKKEAANRNFQLYVDSLRQAQDALAQWESAVGPWPGHPRVTPATIELLDTLIDDMTQVAAKLGCPLT